MKVTKSENVQVVTEDFRGLTIDADGAIWLVVASGAVCFGDEDSLNDGDPPLAYDRGEWRDALKKQGPFTVFNGSITLEN